MRIFVSHSSRQKLLVRELRRQLPQHINLWIDEHELLVGSELDSTLKEAIVRDCDFTILLLDEGAAKSPWVKKELDWAMSREAELGRPFLLPIIVEEEALHILNDSRVTARRYLKCLSFTEEGIAVLARSLSSELFAWLEREVDRIRSREKTSSPLGVLRNAEAMTHGLAEAIKAIVHPYRSENPLSIEELVRRLNSRQLADALAKDEIQGLLDTLQRQHLLSGVAYDEDFIYLSEERYSFKSRLHLDLKRRIARKAVNMVRSNQTIALDGGSTVLELTQQLISRLKGGSLHSLSVVTASLPAAYALLNMLSDSGLGDMNSVCTVYVAGGRARPISLTLISAGPLIEALAKSTNTASWDQGAGFRGILETLGGADISFMGTNGLYRDEGFGVSNLHEVFAKRLMVENARQPVILTDASKFSVQQSEPFAFFSQGLTVITAPDPEYAQTIDRAERLISSTTSRLIMA